MGKPALQSKWFLLTYLLRGMTNVGVCIPSVTVVSTHMPLARHDEMFMTAFEDLDVSTHMPLTRHDDGRTGIGD